MIRLFRHYFPRSLFILGLLEIAILFLSAVLAWRFRMYQIDGTASISGRLPELCVYAFTMYVLMLGVGAYQLSSFRSARSTGARVLLAFVLGILILSAGFFLFPTLELWRSVLFYAVIISLVLIFFVRFVFLSLIGFRRFRQPIIVVGAGERGQRMVDLSLEETSGFRIAEHFSVGRGEDVVPNCPRLAELGSLADFCLDNDVEEIVLALDERRGALPSKQLLEAKLSGVRVIDKTTFLERMTGRVDLATVTPSWLIFSDGFGAGSSTLSLVAKRLFDIVTSLTLLIGSSPVLLIAAIGVRLSGPGPIFYRQERVGQFGRIYSIMKFRSMVVDAERDGAVWAQAADPRVTRFGRIIRSTRIDEIPQIFNVLRGDMSFVGPRPERPMFVDELTESIPLYAERHIVKPGITGWAQLNYPYGASLEDARHKLEYDLYYIKNYSLLLDLSILIQTARVVIWQDGVR